MSRIFSFLLMALLLTAGPAGATEKKTEESGPLMVGVSTFVPWAMQDKDGNYIGFEVDVATALAKDLGRKVEFVPTKWSGIIPALLTGQFDIIISGMSITPERAEKVAFSVPYDYSGMDIVANKERAAGFSSLEDFNKPDVILAARTGGSAKAAVEKYLPKAQIRWFDEESQALQEAVSGRAHAFVSSAPLPALEAARRPTVLFHPIKDTFTKEPIGMALRRGDTELMTQVNAWIEKKEADGTLQKMREYWFQNNEWESRLK
jgi:polar amino acid transport system substrate-binding protein